MDNDDLIGFFRKRAQTPARATPAPSPELVVNRPAQKEAYVAFEAKDKVVRLDIRCAESGMAHAVAYSYLLNLAYDRKTYREFFITVSGMTVLVKGRGLKPIIDALKLHKCEFIQEFDAAEFASPVDATAPFIEAIFVDLVAPGIPAQRTGERNER